MVKVIPAEGPKNARVVIIGEAGGKTEKLLGRPFVGKSGQFLIQHLAKIGLKRNDVYLTNVVKEYCHGRPSPAKIRKYAPHFRKELLGLRPKVVILLGVTARKNTPRDSRSIYLELPHPAAARRFPKARKLFLAGMQKLKKIIKE
jgi:DNA polymerase